MANHKSAAKRARQNIRRASYNTATLSGVRTYERKLRQAVASAAGGKSSAKDKTEVAELLKAYMSQVAKACTKGVVKRETAARKVSRLSKLAQAYL